MLVKLSALQWGHWELFSSHASMHTSQPRGCLEQLNITKDDLMKSKKTLQTNIYFSICVIRVELIDDRRIATSSRLLNIIPLSRLLFMLFTMINRSSKSEWNIYLPNATTFLYESRKFDNKYITHFYMLCYKNCSLQKLLFRYDCDLKNVSIFLFV